MKFKQSHLRREYNEKRASKMIKRYLQEKQLKELRMFSVQNLRVWDGARNLYL